MRLRKNTLLIGTGAGLSIFKPYSCERFSKISRKHINETTLIPFNSDDPHKAYFCNLDIKFDGLIGSDFLEHYKCVIDYNSRQLCTNFKIIPLLKSLTLH